MGHAQVAVRVCSAIGLMQEPVTTTQAEGIRTATILVTAGVRRRLADIALRRRLSRGTIGKSSVGGDAFEHLLAAIGRDRPAAGLAALRFWGQTGQRPQTWIAAADPVYLEPRLDHLCLHALDENSLDAQEVAALMRHLQATLGNASELGFIGIGSNGYVRATVPLATATSSPAAVHGQRPDDFLPHGEEAGPTRRLQSEIEMALHEHPTNIERAKRGLPPVNALWLWGGGHVPENQGANLPPLFASADLLTGLWRSANAPVAAWPGSVTACANACDADFAAVLPDSPDDPAGMLWELEALLGKRRVDAVVVIFTDGVRVDLRRSDRLRFWRGVHPLFGDRQ